MRSFLFARHLLASLDRASRDYRMIPPAARVAVGVSGGKDSLALAALLSLYRRYAPGGFDLLALTVDEGFPGADFSAVTAFCEEIEVPHILVSSDIYERVIAGRASPCAACARLRRGILLHEAASRGCTALALAHHAEDAAATFLLNLFYEGRLGCFSPVTPCEAGGREITVIRPLLRAREKSLRYFANRNALPVIPSRCPADASSARVRMGDLLRALERDSPGAVHRILLALERGGIDGWGEGAGRPA